MTPPGPPPPPSPAGRTAGADGGFAVHAPAITLPKGGGALNGIGEKFAANPVTGTGSMRVPIAVSPGRSGFGPDLSLSYDSGAGTGPFGFGWSLSLPAISRRTDKGLPQYRDADEADIFILSGAEDLTPVLVETANGWQRLTLASPASEPGYLIQRYRPRVEGLFARIERWTETATGISHWRSISRDNVTTIYGKDAGSRIADPADVRRVFTWLIRESRDDKGNAIFYDYKQEDAAGVSGAVWEGSRVRAAQFPHRYLKSIRYGPATPVQPGEDLNKRADWLFEILLDYGEHDPSVPTTAQPRQWPTRLDPFSRYRSAFEIRQYRLCRRFLMFHHLPRELGGVTDCLVRSTDLFYQEGTLATVLTGSAQAGYVQNPNGGYVRKALPQLDFRYSEAQVDDTVRPVAQADLRNLPQGVDGSRYQWLDLDSEGLSGVVTEQAGAWLYKRNLGGGRLAAAERIRERPSAMSLAGGQAHFLDLAGEGRLDLVNYGGLTPGFYERSPDGGWAGFRTFRSLPTLNVRNPNARFIDVTGDGFPDILVSEDTVFAWYQSCAKEGFAAAGRTAKDWNEEEGPAIVFADPTHSIFLADMVGDGLSDIVRIRNGEVCFWPNLGYGRFGAKIIMGSSPRFEAGDLFDPRRIRLADVDGSGTTDIVYIGHDGVSVYFNQAGNAFSLPRRLARLPATVDLTSVTVVDLLGNGTACLVWSSPLPADARSPMRYIDLMGGQKPHLLDSIANNMGVEIAITYSPSTQFYLADRRAGRPWITRLPFPVHVVQQVETNDLVSNVRLVTSYSYRHGLFDGTEREFRGFAFVEQRDAESVVGAFDLPAIVTRTWFHNGAWLEEGRLEGWFKDPANLEYFSGDAQAASLIDPDLPDGLSLAELREAARALKGSILRQEIYADDGDKMPYSASERSYEVRCLQPRGPNLHASFYSHPRETIDYHYERDPTDPRISHSLTLEVDDFGHVLRSAAIGYARRVPADADQGLGLATLIETRYTNVVLDDVAYRAPLPAEVRTYELTAPGLAKATPLAFSEVDAFANAAAAVNFTAQPTAELTEKRLIGIERTLYRKDDLTALLPLGQLEPLALKGEAYRLALTTSLLALLQPNATIDDLTTTLTGGDGGYVDLDGDGGLWAPSGKSFLSLTTGDPPAVELPRAQAHFYLPNRYQDPFGNVTTVTYDVYDLLVASTLDAVGNEVSAKSDYRVLRPTLVTDANGNRAIARFDALGLLVGTAVAGKVAGPAEGDSFDSFTVDLAPADIADFFDAPDPTALAIEHLGTATTRILYDLKRVPVCAASVARETHVSDLGPAQTAVRLKLVYSDGLGREAQTRMLAAPGPLDPSQPAAPIVTPRWIASGEKVYQNKGLPVREYEPFFSATPQFGIENWGVSSTLFYDPTGRMVARLHPDHSYEKFVFGPWQQTNFDGNDTVLLDPSIDPDVASFFSRLPAADYAPSWYAQRQGGGLGADAQDAAAKAAKHAGTPTLAHQDVLGRTTLTVADNGLDGSGVPQAYATRSVLDIAGRQTALVDALGRTAVRYDHDLLGAVIHQASMEAGENWMLAAADGKPIRSWNSRRYAFRSDYDALRRPVRSTVQGGDAGEANPSLYPTAILSERLVYGDSADTGLTEAQRQQANVKGRLYRHDDCAGSVTIDRYDFKGNSLGAARVFVSDYTTAPDWSKSPKLDGETFATATKWDALNRPIAVTTPDASVYRPTFDPVGLLATIDVAVRGGALTPLVTRIDHDALGRRTRISFGNGAKTQYGYDTVSLRLLTLTTTRPQGLNGTSSQIFADPATVQDLRFAYDPVGNVTRLTDAALRTVFNGQKVDPVCDYRYDPLYRLTDAGGREHVGQSAFAFVPPNGDFRDYPFVGAAALNDPRQLRTYAEHYSYDQVGNILSLAHKAGGGNGNWTRTYGYDELSLLEPANRSNRLSQTIVQGASQPNAYDALGNVVRMQHLPLMRWNFRDELAATSRQSVGQGTPETTWYVYDAAGRRVRKVTEGPNGLRRRERCYLGTYERYRKYDNAGNPTLVRETLHVMDDKQRIASFETQTVAASTAIGAPAPALRLQLANHLGSACLELDEAANLISYEEYSPYGVTSFQVGRNAAEASLKRYRYTARERDEETGLAYHMARYYAPWLGRWTACDPIGVVDGPNLYRYCRNDPTSLSDNTGHSPVNEGSQTGLMQNFEHVVRAAVLEGKQLTGDIARAVRPVVHELLEDADQASRPLDQLITPVVEADPEPVSKQTLWGLGVLAVAAVAVVGGTYLYLKHSDSAPQRKDAPGIDNAPQSTPGKRDTEIVNAPPAEPGGHVDLPGSANGRVHAPGPTGHGSIQAAPRAPDGSYTAEKKRSVKGKREADHTPPWSTIKNKGLSRGEAPAISKPRPDHRSAPSTTSQSYRDTIQDIVDVMGLVNAGLADIQTYIDQVGLGNIYLEGIERWFKYVDDPAFRKQHLSNDAPIYPK